MARQLQLSFTRQLSTSTTRSLSLEDPDVPLSLEQEPEHRISGAQGTTDVAIMRRSTVGSWQAFGQAKWKRIYPWIEERQDGIYCAYCSHAGHEVRSRSPVFVTKPFTGNRPDKLGRHETCKAHIQNQQAYMEHQVRVSTNTTIVDIIDRSNSITVDENAICDALRCLYFLHKNEIPYTTNFKDLKELCVMLGNDTLPNLNKSRNTNYESAQTMDDFTNAIGYCLEEEILHKLEASPFFSIIIDEATDIAVTKQLGLCVQYFDIETAIVKVCYLKLLEIATGNAEAITDAILSYFISHPSIKIDINKLAGAATDGASVMTGCHEGVIARIKSLAPTLISTHCSTHRLSLAASQACNSNDSFKRFEKIINQIYTFFSKSSVRTAKLKEIQKVLEEPQLKLQRATETRWLSHQTAVDALRRTLVSVHSLLEQEAIDGEALAYGLCKEIEKPAILFLSNMLSILGNFSKTFQLAHLNLLTVDKLINAAISQLDAIKDDVLHTGYMAHLEETMQSINFTGSLDEKIFVNNATSYLND